MLNFSGVRAGTQTIAELASTVNYHNLHTLTDEMIDTMLWLIRDATDADVVFTPVDPEAHDTFGSSDEAEMAWSLGHVIVHATASAEEGAAMAVNQARGLVIVGRSRYEIDWRVITTVAQARNRLFESRRMRHAFLNAWPDPPHLDVTISFGQFGEFDAIGRYLFGMMHDDAHVGQIGEIMRQARAARSER